MKVPTVVPDDVVVPVSVETDRFRVRLVDQNDVAYEFEALMTSPEYFHRSTYFDPSDQLWPRPDMSPEFVWAKLGTPAWDHHRRSTFHYGVFDLDEMQQLAGFTISYSRSPSYQAQVVLWVRESVSGTELQSEILTFLKAWLTEAWPIETVAFPGWEQDWSAFSRPKLVPDNFEVPNNFTEDGSFFRLMGHADFLEDLKACFDDVAHLQGVMGPDEKEWPDPTITPRIHLGDLGWCEWSHYHRHFFAYCVYTPDTMQQRGCVYVHPTHAKGYDAEVLTWVTKTEYDAGFDEALFSWTKEWIERVWPMKSVGYPGRETDWETWRNLPSK